MDRRQSNHWCFGLVMVGFSVYLGGMSLFGSPLLILGGLLIVILAMSAWAVAGLNNIPDAGRTPLDVSLGIDLSRTHLADPPLPDHADLPHVEVHANPPAPEEERQHLSSSVT